MIDDLNKLHHNGNSVNVKGTAMRLFGGLATISADNLSAHAVAGFRRVFNSGRICRQCIILYDKKAQLLRDADATIRTEFMHCYHVEAQRIQDCMELKTNAHLLTCLILKSQARFHLTSCMIYWKVWYL